MNRGFKEPVRLLAAALVLASTTVAHTATHAADLPTGGSVVAGQGAIAGSGSQMTITQSTPKLAIDWQSYNIGTGHSVTYVQPDRSSIALNRVTGGDASAIFGALNANGRVFLVNPNGILFGRNASVNVGGLVASSLDISNDDFLNDRYIFKGAGGRVVNEGDINADGGAVALLGGVVSNQGTITARLGSVALAAGSGITLDFAGDGLYTVQVDEALAGALAENRQLIQADGGTVILTAQAANALLATVVNNEGIIQARTVAEREGRIYLLGGDEGVTRVAGTLDASAPDGGDGGFVETSGAHVRVLDGVNITALAADGQHGTWLIDPVDFTIAADGGDMTAAALVLALSGANVEIQSADGKVNGSGNINVRDAVNWVAGTTLTLTAVNDINIDAAINGTNASAGLTLNAGNAINVNAGAIAAVMALNHGSSGYNIAPKGFLSPGTSLTINGQTYTLVRNATNLQAVGSSGFYALANNIFLSGQYSGALIANFGGTFAGLGNTINGLDIAATDLLGATNLGLFGTNTGTIRDLGVANANVVSSASIAAIVTAGGLAGRNTGTLRNVWSSGSIDSGGGLLATYEVGGLVGHNEGTVTNSYSSVAITGSGGATRYAGGLAGRNEGTTSSINTSYATGSVSGSGTQGGLVGHSEAGLIRDTYATGNVAGSAGGWGGGLVGYSNGEIRNSYALGVVSTGTYLGGLVGQTGSASNTLNSFFAITNAGGSAINGGLSLRDSSSSGALTGGGGRSYTDLQNLSTFTAAGWQIDDQGGSAGFPWRIYNGQTTPLLRGLLTPLTISRTPDYDGVGFAGEITLGNIAGITYAGNLPGVLGTANITANTLTLSSTENDSYTATTNATITGLYSLQDGYDIGYGSPTRRIETTGSLAGDIHLPASLTWTSGALRFDTTGNIITGGNTRNITDINGAGFDLYRGFWTQNANGGTLADFSVTDFRLGGPASSSAFKRVQDGDGTALTPYLITDVYGLQGIGSSSIFLPLVWQLANNIDASSTTGWNSGAGFTPIGGGYSYNFSGIFDGANHAISNLFINAIEQNAGLFGRAVSGSSISNLTLNNIDVTGTVSVGGLAGHNAGTISNIDITSGAVMATNEETGGLVGYNSGTISNSSAGVTVIAGNQYVGGLVGNNSGGTITGSHATGDVSANGLGYYAGGLVGRFLSGSISGSHATGEVNATIYVGGLVGGSAGDITGSYATGDVTATSNVAGGLVGERNGGLFEDNHATGHVTGVNFVGGLIGMNTAGDIANSYATGNATGDSYVAGLVGSMNGNIAMAYATGNVTATGTPAGGLVGGINTGMLENVYATGNVSGTVNAGGLVGYSQVTISNAYATGTVTGTTDIGGLVGFNNTGTVYESFYATTDASNSDINNNGDTSAGWTGNSAGTGLSLANLRNLGTFTGGGWYIDGEGGTGSTWRIYDGYTTPLLRHFLTTYTIYLTPDYDGSGTLLGNIASVYTPLIDGGDPYLLGDSTIVQGDTLTLRSDAAESYTATSNASVPGLYSVQEGYDLVFDTSRTIATPGSMEGEVQLPASLTWSSGTLRFENGGPITTIGFSDNRTVINGAGFELVDGRWEQNTATLPGFNVVNFNASYDSRFLRVLGGDGTSGDPWLIADVYGLQGMATAPNYWTYHWALANNIDASSSYDWTRTAFGVSTNGFVPIGDAPANDTFDGVFDGAGYTISDLFIDRGYNNADHVGLFASLGANAVVSDLTLADAVIVGNDNVGALTGYNRGSISNVSVTNADVTGHNAVGGVVGHNAGILGSSSATGVVSGNTQVGGLAGYSDIGINNSHASVNVTATGDDVGGLVGYLNGASVINSYATGSVSGNYRVGGLVGSVAVGTITHSYATGAVESNNAAEVGGLVGYANTTNITNSYASGHVTGNSDDVGGLVGFLLGGSITEAYATGNVSGATNVGGLAGQANGGANIDRTYALGAVSGSSNLGGLVGYLQGANVYSSFFATTDAGNNPINNGGTNDGTVWTGNDHGWARSLTDLRNLSTFANEYWYIDDEGGTGNTWRIYDGHTTPLLRSFLTAHTINGTHAYDGTNTTFGDIAQVTWDTLSADPYLLGVGTHSEVAGTTLTLGSNEGGEYTATSNATLTGLYSSQQGYDIILDTSRTISTPGSDAGDIRLPALLTWTSGTLRFDTYGYITTGISGVNTTAINGAGFELMDGRWEQVTASLPVFNVNNFFVNYGSRFLRVLGGSGLSVDPWRIADIYGLQGMDSAPSFWGSSRHWTLANNIDASSTSGWSHTEFGVTTSGFTPIGGDSPWGDTFAATFDGAGYTISDLYIDRNGGDYAGLFSAISATAVISNLTLADAVVTGASEYAGALVGYNNQGTITNVSATDVYVQGGESVGGIAGVSYGAFTGNSATGEVSGYSQVGGLIGNGGGSIANSHADVVINAGDNYAGGLVGYFTNGQILNSYATGDVTASNYYAGGLVGFMSMASGSVADIIESWASGEVTVGEMGGGLVGYTDRVSILRSYASGNVNSNVNGGGLVGYMGGGSIADSYAIGNVDGVDNLGGLAGFANDFTTIQRTYATGAVTGIQIMGGLVGDAMTGAVISDSFYATTDVFGGTINNGSTTDGSWTGNGNGTGVSFAALQDLDTFDSAGWSIDDEGGTSSIWRIYDGYTTPLLRNFLTLRAIVGTPDYDGVETAYSDIAAVTWTGLTGLLGGTLTNGTTLTLTSTAADSYTATSNATASGFYSGQQGYDIISYGAYSRTISTPGSALGDIQLPASLAWTSGTLVLDTSGTITTGTSGVNTTAINGAGFMLMAGTWEQNAAVLPAFSATDFGLAYGRFLRVKGGDGTTFDPYLLTDVYGLQGIDSSYTDLLSAHWRLDNSIDASVTSGWNSGAGFNPIGALLDTAFTGSFDGAGHTLSDLFIDHPSDFNVGLFGAIGTGGGVHDLVLANAVVYGDSSVGALAGVNEGTVTDVSVPDATVVGSNNTIGGLVGYNLGNIMSSAVSGSVTGVDDVGGLVGRNGANWNISNSHAAVNVQGNSYVGGLVGRNESGTLISGSYASGSVTGGFQYVGGLVGYHYGSATIVDSHATGNVSGGNRTGGLVGQSEGDIRSSYASGDVLGADMVGGLAGYSFTVEGSYATGTVTGDSNVGGLVGFNGNRIEDSYATGDVIATGVVAGGLVGDNGNASIFRSYATGSVSGAGSLGGLVGYSDGFIDASFYATRDGVNNPINNEGSVDALWTGNSEGEARTLTQLQSLSTFYDAYWGIDDEGGTGNVWRIYDGHTTPLLRSFLTQLVITGTPVYDGAGTVPANIGEVSWDMGSIPVADPHLFGTATPGQGTALVLTSNADDEYTASSNAVMTGLYSGQRGYDIIYQSERTIATPGTSYGDIRLPVGGLSWSSGSLIINTEGSVTPVAINGDVFELIAGSWVQNANGGTLEAFNVNDFRLVIDNSQWDMPGDRYFLRVQDGNGTIAAPYQLADVYGLQGITLAYDLRTAAWQLAGDIDASSTVNWNNGAGFKPIGESNDMPFNGSFDGKGRSISNLYIDFGDETWVGLLGAMGIDSDIRNLVLVDAVVNGASNVGALAGFNEGGVIANVAVRNATVSGDGSVGGLVGSNWGTISGSSVTGSVDGGFEYIGGLAGANEGDIVQSWAAVAVNGNTGQFVGGLVGNNGGNIYRSYASGQIVASGDYVGGLVGGHNYGEITDAYATGDVTGGIYVGGLVGYNNYGEITNTYATGTVTATGSEVGALLGYTDGGTLTANFFDATGIDNGYGTAANLTALATFATALWDIDDAGSTGAIWRIYEGQSTPLLRSFLTQVLVSTDAGSSKTYDGLAGSGTTGYTTDVPGSTLDGTLSYGTSFASVGSYTYGSGTLQLSGLYSHQQGYDISYDSASSFAINPATLMVHVAPNFKTYDGTPWAGGFGVSYSGFVNGETDALVTGTPVFAGDSQGAVNAGDYQLFVGGGVSAPNYTIVPTIGTLTIGKALLTVTANDANKVYDSFAFTGGNGVTVSGFVGSEDDSVLTGTLSYDGSAQGAVNAGLYTLTASGLDADNYDFTYQPGELTIDKALLTVTVNDANKVYDGLAFTGGNGVSVSGFVGSEDDSVLTGSVSYDGSAQGAVNAGLYTLTASGLDADNYDFAYEAGELTIDRKAATVTGNSSTVTYNGGLQSVGGFTASGLVAGEDESVLTAVVASGANGTNAGSYANTVSGSDGNYDLTLVDGTLTINPALLTVTVNDANKTYDGLAFTGGNGVSVSGFVGSEDDAVLTGTLSYDGSAQGAVNTGTYTLTASGLAAQNYTFDYLAGELSIDKALLTVTVNDAGKVYDGAAWTGGNGVTVSGFVGSEDDSVLTGTVSYDGSAQGAVNAGVYDITASGLDAQNYDFTYQPGELTIDKALLTVTVNDANKVYDGLAFTGGNGVSISGFVGSEDDSVVDDSALAYGGSAQGAVNVGLYTLTASGLDADNYDFTYSTANFTLSPAELTAHVATHFKTYDGLAFSGGSGVTYSGFVNGETAALVTGTPTFGGDSQGAVNAGDYQLFVTGGVSAPNYTIVPETGMLTINKASAVVTANSGSYTYNGLLQSISGFTATGLVNGETESVLSGVTTSGGTGTNAGSYAHIASGMDTNYDLFFVDGTLTIDKAVLTVTANDASKVYDAIAYTGGNGVSVSGFVGGEDDSVLTGVLSYDGSAQGAVNAGVYDITASGLDAQNYDFSYQPGELTIDKALLTVTVNDANKVYDGLAFTGGNGVTYSGFAGSEDDAVLTGVLSYDGSAQGAVNAGAYDITASGLDAQNYDFSYQPGELTIDKAMLTVTVNDANKVYDGLAFTGGNGVTYSGFAGSEDDSVLTGVLSYDGTAQGAVNAGLYTLTASGLNADNYDFAYQAGELTIDRKAATVTANSSTVTYNGTAQSVSGFTATGLVLGEDESVLTGVATSGASGTNAGSYANTVSGSDGNYDLTLVDGTLTINRAAATVTANSGTVTYNGLLQSVSGFTATGLVNGETESVLTGVTTTGGSGTNAGNYSHTASGSDGNYELAFVDGSLTIDPASLTVTANNASKTYDGLAWSGGNGVSYAGFVNGEDELVLSGTLSYDGDAQGAVNAGSYTITAGGLDALNYTITYADGVLTVDKALATVTANSSTVTYNGLLQSVGGFTATGLVNGETESVLTGVTTAGGSGTNAGNYSHTASGSDGNYELTFADGSLTIDPALLTVTANNAGKTYDGLAWTGGNNVSYAGFVNGEDESVLGGVLSYGGDAQGAVKAGSYTISASGLNAANYAIGYVNGTLTVDKAAATVTANSDTVTYNGLLQSVGGFTATGLVNGETESVLIGLTESGGAGTNAGNYTHSVSGTDDNYELTFIDGSLTIDPASLTVTANNASKTYDGLAWSGGNDVSYAGFVNGEDELVLGGTLSYDGDAQGAVNAGSYTITAGGLDALNYAISYVDGALTITPAALTVAANNASKTYDGVAWSGGNGVSYVGFVNGEDEAVLSGMLSYDGDAQGAMNAGSYTITAGGLDALNYTISYGDGTLTIDKAALTVSGITAGNKVYDGNITASVDASGAVLSGLVAGEDLGLTVSGEFDGKNVGTGKIVTLTSSYDPLIASNYVITDQASATADITPAALMVSGITAGNKVYDGNTTAVVDASGVILTGLVAGEDLGLTVSGEFDGKNVGTGKVVTLTSSYDPLVASNYAITDQASTTADITPKALTVSGITAGSKVYDGNATASVDTTGAILDGLVGSDDLTVSATGEFSDKNAAFGKTVTLTSSYGGVDAGNYSITDQTSALADITKANATVTANSGTVTYNGLLQSVSGFTASGLVGGEDESVLTGVSTSGGTGTNAGNYAHSVSGSDGNYELSFVNGSLTIDKAALTVSGITAGNKIYDGNADAAVDASGAVLTGLVAGEDLGLTVSGEFDGKNVGTGKVVTLTSSYDSLVASNYVITEQGSTTANITPKALTVSGITAGNKVYDGNADATVDTSGVVLAGLVAGEDLGLTVTGAFDNKQAGTGKTVNLSSSYDALVAANYAITGQDTTTADITPKALAISGITAGHKVYDGNISATVDTSALILDGLVGTDDIGLTVSGLFADKNVGNGKTVSLTSNANGVDADNYLITSQTSTTANITPKALTVSGITAGSKVYDGNTTATVDASGAVLTGLVIGEDLGLTVSGEFSDKNAGTGKTVNLTSSYDSLVASNYAITDQTSALADITKASATVTANSDTVTYNGLNQSVAGYSATGLVNGETESVLTGLTESGGAGTNAGSYVHSVSGTDGNYDLTFVDGSLVIDPAALTVIVNNAGKTYDGQAWTGGNGVSYAGFVNGENASVLSGVVSYGGDAQGAVNAGSYTLTASGLDAGNYTLGYVDGVLTVDKAALTVSTSDVVKTYDGTTDASGAVVVVGGQLYGTDSLSGGNFLFADKNAGTGKTVMVSGVTVSDGNGGGNYDLILVDNTTSTIGRAAATVTANSNTVTYNGLAQSISGYTVSGLVNGEAESVLTGLTESGGTGTNAGSYVHSVSGTDGNYDLTFVDGALTINKALLTITANNASKTYGEAVSLTTATVTGHVSIIDGVTRTYYKVGNTGGYTVAGLVGGDSVSGVALASDGMAATANAGAYVITASSASGTGLANYTIGYSNGTLTVNRAALTVIANNASKVHDGVAWSGGNGVSYVGFVNGESASVLGGSLGYGGSAQGALEPGDYVLTASGLSSGNYNIGYVDGGLAITVPPVAPSLPGYTEALVSVQPGVSDAGGVVVDDMTSESSPEASSGPSGTVSRPGAWGWVTGGNASGADAGAGHGPYQVIGTGIHLKARTCVEKRTAFGRSLECTE